MWSAGERRARETERERNGTQRDLSRGQKVNGTIEWERFNQEPHKSPPHEHPLDLISLDPFFLSTIYRPRETARCSSFRPPSLPTLCLTRSRFMPRISPPCPGHGINYAPYALAGILQPVPVFAPLLIRAPLHPLQFRLLSCFPHPITTIPSLRSRRQVLFLPRSQRFYPACFDVTAESWIRYLRFDIVVIILVVVADQFCRRRNVTTRFARLASHAVAKRTKWLTQRRRISYIPFYIPFFNNIVYNDKMVVNICDSVLD